jgi:hypothetical protein
MKRSSSSNKQSPAIRPHHQMTDVAVAVAAAAAIVAKQEPSLVSAASQADDAITTKVAQPSSAPAAVTPPAIAPAAAMNSSSIATVVAPRLTHTVAPSKPLVQITSSSVPPALPLLPPAGKLMEHPDMLSAIRASKSLPVVQNVDDGAFLEAVREFAAALERREQWSGGAHCGASSAGLLREV